MKLTQSLDSISNLRQKGYGIYEIIYMLLFVEPGYWDLNIWVTGEWNE